MIRLVALGVLAALLAGCLSGGSYADDCGTSHSVLTGPHDENETRTVQFTEVPEEIRHRIVEAANGTSLELTCDQAIEAGLLDQTDSGWDHHHVHYLDRDGEVRYHVT